ncbi:hypothetical protein F4861DRAFT_461290 [Xylaria intraflava]|nr:hypothetical protein F4861DRAFT_461290 [Xylaria intraflava]
MWRILTLVPAFLGVALAVPRAATDKLAPVDVAPAGCLENPTGKFEITVTTETEKGKSTPEKEVECDAAGGLVVTLRDGQIVDAEGRIGYIASNYQFQFDAPAQSGALFTGGFSVCEGNTLALGSSRTFFQCRSGDFYNLYDRTWAAQCEPAFIIAVPCTSEGTASQTSAGEVIGTTVVPTTIVTALSDGQPQVVPTAVTIPVYSASIPDTVSELTDGEVQVTSIDTAELSMTMTAVFTTQLTSKIVPGFMTTSNTPPWTPAATPEGTAEVMSGSSNSTASSPISSAPEETPSPTDEPASPSALPSASEPLASASAPPTGGSSHVHGDSRSALVVGILMALLYL